MMISEIKGQTFYNIRSIIAFVCIILFCSENIHSQVDNHVLPHNSALDTIPAEAMSVFQKYAAVKETTKLHKEEKYTRDSFIKRFSIHTNTIDWVTLLPNLGIEFDLSSSRRNNYSVSVFGKYNGNSRKGKFVFNVKSARLEFRKYWRTGKYGSSNKYYSDFDKICSDASSVYYNADSLAGHSYYVDTLGHKAKSLGVEMESLRATYDMTQEERDSLDFAEDSLGIRNNRFRSWFYNSYHKFRRNVTSGRTLENPRNWRAYYLGLWTAIDDWDISLTGKGKCGRGLGLGVVAGYTLPLLPQKYPKEGSLDLDLGLALGWKAVQYDAYNYDADSQNYIPDASRTQESWKIVPYPIIQDIHVSLVWRFRGIKNKVDRSLIDDYEKKVSEYNQRINDNSAKYGDVIYRREELQAKINERIIFQTDSVTFWSDFHKRRLLNAHIINPDTTFTGKDLELYLKLIKGVDVEEQEKYLKNQRDSIQKVLKLEKKRQRKAAKSKKE